MVQAGIILKGSAFPGITKPLVLVLASFLLWSLPVQGQRPLALTGHTFLFSGFNTGGLSFGLGARYGTVEAEGFYTTRPSTDWGAGAMARFYIPGLGRDTRPYLESRFSAAYMPGFRITSQGNGGATFRALTFNPGVEHRFVEGLSGYFSYSPVSWTWTKFDDPDGLPLARFRYPSVTFGLKYDLLLRGGFSEEPSNQKTYPGRERFFLSYRTLIWPEAEERLGNRNEMVNHNLSLDWEFHRMFRLSGLVQVGTRRQFSDGVVSTPFGFKSMGLGVKWYGIRRGKWAYFNDIFFVFSPNPQIRYLDKMIHLSHNIAYQVLPGVEADLGYGFSIAQGETVPTWEIGLTYGFRKRK